MILVALIAEAAAPATDASDKGPWQVATAVSFVGIIVTGLGTWLTMRGQLKGARETARSQVVAAREAARREFGKLAIERSHKIQDLKREAYTGFDAAAREVVDRHGDPEVRVSYVAAMTRFMVYASKETCEYLGEFEVKPSAARRDKAWRELAERLTAEWDSLTDTLRTDIDATVPPLDSQA